MTATTKTYPFLAFVLIGALLALGPAANATTELVHEFSIAVDSDDFGFPFLAETTPDGGHLYVYTFPPNESLLTFERVGQTLELRDSLSLAAAGMQSFSDIELSEDGAFLFAGEFSTGTLRIFARDAESGALSLEQSFEKILGDQPGSANGVIDGVRVTTDTGVVWGRPGFPQTGGVLVELNRNSTGSWALAPGTAAVESGAMASLQLAQIIVPLPIKGLELASLYPGFATGSFDAEGIRVRHIIPGTERICSLTYAQLEAATGASIEDPILLQISQLAFGTIQIEIVDRDGNAVGFLLDLLTTSDCELSSIVEFQVFEAETGPVADVATTADPRVTFINFAMLEQDQALGAFALPTTPDPQNPQSIFTETLVDPPLFDGRPLEVTISNPFPGDDPISRFSTGPQPQTGPLTILGYLTVPNPPRIIGVRLTTDEIDAGCIPGPNTLCLSGFSVETEWEDFQGNTGSGTAVPGSSDSGMFWFFRPSNWEMLVKVLDGCAQNGHFWVLYAATTNVGFDVTVSHDEMGSKSYGNAPGALAPAEMDMNAFQCTPAQVQAARARLESDPQQVTRELGSFLEEAAVRGILPTSAPRSQGTCTDDDDTLCLTPDRFRVEVDWRDFQGNTGVGHVVPLRASDSGLFWFFDAANWELLIKVLDACILNDRFWLLAAATTDVEYTLTITDTVTGEEVVVFNPLGNPSAAVIDVDAFAGCQ